MSSRTPRQSADERREALITAAIEEFATRGFEGASTDAIARNVGISQPYLFRLFGTKKELFIAATERCFADTHERFRAAAEGRTGWPALAAMGMAYREMITAEPVRLRAQMQAYAACDDPAIRLVVRRGFARLVELAESTGASPAEVSSFFARGMLMNVTVLMGLDREPVGWGQRLIDGSLNPTGGRPGG